MKNSQMSKIIIEYEERQDKIGYHIRWKLSKYDRRLKSEKHYKQQPETITEANEASLGLCNPNW